MGNGVKYSTQSKSSQALEDIVDLISSINEISDEKALKGILSDCIEMIGSEELKYIREIANNIEEKIIQEYRIGYTDSFTKYDKMEPDELAKMEGIKVHEKKGIKIIELMGADFAFLSHTGGIAGNNERCCCTLITDENFSTFGNGINTRTYIFSDFSPRRIKIINMGDAGFSKYHNTYISANDLPYSTICPLAGQFYNETTISTCSERGDEGLKANAILTTNKMGTAQFEEILNSATKEDQPKTIYILHEDVYKDKDEKEKQEQEKYNKFMSDYLSSLDPQLLNLILLSTGGEEEKIEIAMQEILDRIVFTLKGDIPKSRLRRNASRYWQFTQGKREVFLVPYNIMEKFETKLKEMKNELLDEHKIKDKVKEIKKEYER